MTQPICQGDVMLVPVSEIPDGERVSGVHVLALGEVTGHAHRLFGASMVTVDGQRYVEAAEQAYLSHEDHGPVVVAPGAYRVVQQTEPDLLGSVRNVAD